MAPIPEGSVDGPPNYHHLDRRTACCFVGVASGTEARHGGKRSGNDFWHHPKSTRWVFLTILNINVSPAQGEDYIERLRSVIRSFGPKPLHHRDSRTLFVHPDLATCEKVFVRNDAVRSPLQKPHKGPYTVLERRGKYFAIQLAGKTTNISVDRLKPAYVLNLDSAEQSKPMPTTPAIPGTKMDCTPSMVGDCSQLISKVPVPIPNTCAG